MGVKELLGKVKKVDEEVSGHDMESGGGSAFINAGGVYPVTIKEAFLSKTAKGGIQLDIFFGGDNILDMTLYIVSKKGKSLITTCEMNGKTVTLPSYKMFKQIYFLATGEGLTLEDMELEEDVV